MESRRTTVLVLAVALAAAGCASDTHKSQVKYAQRLAPSRIAQQGAVAPASVRTLKVRVYADEEYRSQNLRWQEKFALLVDRANDVIRPAFGVQLEVTTTQLWQRESSDQDLDAMLSELQLVDAGEDAAWVIGLVTALPHVTSSLHMLGGARPLGRHIILRGFNDTAERKVLDKVLGTLSGGEREELYLARKAHKELAVFLHEWGHTLGAMHTTQPSSLMAPAYDAAAAEFAEANARVLRLGLEHRGLRDDTGAVAARWNKALLELLEKHKWDGWLDEDYQLMLGMLAQGPQASPEVKVSAALTPASRRAFYRALDLQRASRFDEAFREILPLTEQYDGEPEVMKLGCAISARAKGTAYPTPMLCERAAALAPEAAGALLELSHAHFEAGDESAGTAALRSAHERLAAAGDDAPAEQWLELAARYQSLTAITWAEQALARAGDGERAESLRAWAGQTRRRYGLGPGTVTPEEEADYLQAVKEILSLTYGNQYDAAERMAKAARKQYPDAAGPEVAMCDLELRRGRRDAARRHCARAVERYGQAVWAMYLLASIDAAERKHGAAIRGLERAIELEPAMQALWRLLAREYEATGADGKLQDLRQRHKERFNQEL